MITVTDYGQSGSGDASPGVDAGPGRQGIRLPPALCFLIDDPQAVTVPITGPVLIREPYPSITELRQMDAEGKLLFRSVFEKSWTELEQELGLGILRGFPPSSRRPSGPAPSSAPAKAPYFSL